MSVTTFWTISLIVHGLLALALLGALTHQAVAVVLPVRRAAGNFVARYRAVPAAGYATAICILYLLTFLVGAWIYTKYRVYVRIPLEQYGFWKTTGAFEFKEHVVSVGLALLPAYWWLWRGTKGEEFAAARTGVTVVLALIVWYAFLTGHVLNNVRGFGS